VPAGWDRPFWTRFGVVALTVVLATVIVAVCGPPVPFRVGEITGRDLRVRATFTVINFPKTELIREEAETHWPSIEEPPPVLPPVVVEKYPVGMPIVRRGAPITEAQLMLLREELRAYQRTYRWEDHARRVIGLFLTVSLLTTIVVLYINRFQPALAASLPKVLGMCGLVLLTLLVALLINRPPWYGSIIPLTMAALTLTIAINAPFALLMSLCLAILTTVALGTDLNGLLVLIGGMATAVLLLHQARTRTRFVLVAAGAGVAFMAMTVATELLSGQTTTFIVIDSLRHLAWSVLGGFILSGCLPLVERCFDITTDVRLLELADSSHPLLKELIRRAPGTFTHSMTVATLAEAAAEAIEADTLLTRVGSYYHDIGKMLKPQYFIENQHGENRHDGLEPALSTLVIHGHVKDGVALAEQHRLPRPIIDFIEQHHGTTLVEYFYREALRLQEQNGHGGELEHVFRYPGPKPRSREIGIVMLADAVESASRALPTPTSGSLRKLVHDMLMKRLLDGQFCDSGLTLTELHKIEESLCKGLIALYHARIRYPAPIPGAAKAS
jgi:hypothetical protein